MAHIMSQVEPDCRVIVLDAMDRHSMAECFAKKAEAQMEDPFPMHPETTARNQTSDKKCQKHMKLAHKNKKEFHLGRMEETSILMCGKQIVVPHSLQGRTMAWHHLCLRYPGVTRMTKTLQIVFWWDRLAADAERYVHSCPECQKNKKV